MDNISVIGSPDFLILESDFPLNSTIELTPLKVNLLLPDNTRVKLSDLIDDIRLIDNSSYNKELNSIANSETLGCLGNAGCLYALLGPLGCLLGPLSTASNTLNGSNQPKSHITYEIDLVDHRTLRISSIYPIYAAIINVVKIKK